MILVILNFENYCPNLEGMSMSIMLMVEIASTVGLSRIKEISTGRSWGGRHIREHICILRKSVTWLELHFGKNNLTFMHRVGWNSTHNTCFGWERVPRVLQGSRYVTRVVQVSLERLEEKLWKKISQRLVIDYIGVGGAGFPDGAIVENPPANAGDMDLIPGSGRSTGGGNGNPLQYFCLENPMDRGAWWVTVHGVSKSGTRLSDWAQGRSKATREIMFDCKSVRLGVGGVVLVERKESQRHRKGGAKREAIRKQREFLTE